MYNMTESFILGLATGASCLASCGNVILSIIMSENKKLLPSIGYLLSFLGGRLIAYIAFCSVSIILASNASGINPIVGATGQIILGIFLIIYAVKNISPFCLSHGITKRINSICRHRMNLMVAAAGLLSSLNVCPPIVALVGNITTSTNDAAIIISAFLAFFIGSSIFFIPLPFTSLLKDKKTIATIGRFAAIIAGTIFIVRGIALAINYY